MGRKALTAVVWLISAWTVTCLESGEAPRLYRQAKGVYASAYANAAPYGAFSFQVPTVVPAAKATQLIPVKQESIVIQNSNGFLKDSYGNKFVETPTSLAYKTTFPQQFVQLQHLPAHLSQPLTAAPSYHFPQGPPQAFFGAQYRLPSLDAVTSPVTRYGAFAQPFVYAGNNVKSFTPASDQQFQFGSPPKAQQDSSNNKVVYASQGYNQLQNEPTFQPQEQKPDYDDYYEPPRQQPAPSLKAKVQTPVRHTVKTTHNGKDTVVQIETKPPLPLVDLSLLEPLTFANPVVPQVQHYLPKINALTYSALHPYDAEDKNQKELVVEKTKSYDTSVVKGKPYDEPKKKYKKPTKKTEKDADVYINFESKTEKPSIKVKGKPNDPGYSYEINSPGYKESYNQQVVSYNKETQSDPVTYTYEKQTQKEPVTYTYSHNSKDPGQTKVVQYVKKDPAPGHLVYNFQPEQGAQHKESPKPEPEESDDSNESSEADDESPSSYDHAQYYDTEPHHDNKPASPTQSPQSHPSTHSHQTSQGHQSPKGHPTASTYPHLSSTSHPSTLSYIPQSTPSHAYVTPSHHLKVEHKGQLNHKPTPSYYVVSHKPQYYTRSALTATPKLPPLREYVENLRFIPSYPSPLTKSAIRVDPRQPQSQHPKPQYYIQQTTPRARSEGSMVSQPVIYEKSKKIIIQEESPEEMHSHHEKLSAQMETVGGQDENSEEDFEKSYKEAAYGFPAYDRDSAENEEIYNHNYGEPRDHSGEDIGSPFEQYAEEGDQFPKSSRLGYKDSRDKVQEDYYLGYSLNKPEIMTDRYQSKINYYKMFLKNKPEKLRASDVKKKPLNAKYTVEPSFFDSAPRQKQKQSSQYKSAPTYEYHYDKEARDSSAYASRPLRYKSKTHFVEPQFQYGFEPIAIPRLDSEQETQATNLSPDEKPGTRKKLYKENWYIKKTTTSSKPS